MKRDLTSGNALKNLIAFSVPFFLSCLLQTLYGMVDLFIIGKYGTAVDTCAVSIGSQFMHMITVILVGFSMGGSVLIGNCVGAKNEREKNKAIGNFFTISVIIAFVVSIALFLLLSGILYIIKTPAQALDRTRIYLLVCFAGVPFITLYNTTSGLFRGIGDSKTPLIFVAISAFINMVLDVIFIKYCSLGTLGAALGTVIAQGVSVVISSIFIVKKSIISGICKGDFKPRGYICGNILKIGIPIALQDGFIQVSFMVITAFANMRGVTDSAAVGVVEKVIGILFLVPSAMLSSVSAIVAQNMGAHKIDKAKKTMLYGIVIVIVWGVAAATVFQFIAGGCLSLFSKDSGVIMAGTGYLSAYVWDCIFAGIHFVFSGYFCGISKSGISFLHNSLSVILARIPIAYYASVAYKDTLFPMGLAAPIGSVLSIIICVVAYIVLNKRDKTA